MCCCQYLDAVEFALVMFRPVEEYISNRYPFNVVKQTIDS